MSCEPNATSVAKGLRTHHALAADNDRRTVIVLDNLNTRIGACLTVASSTDYKPVWTGKPILRFGSAASAPSSGRPATASVEVFKKSRRETNGDFMAAAYARRSGRDKLKVPRSQLFSFPLLTTPGEGL